MAEPPRPDSPATENIRAIVELEQQAIDDERWPDRIGLRISRSIGSLRFVVFQVIAFVAWAGWNHFAPVFLRFDPYPWGLLALIVSIEGVLIATFVLIAQNRMSRQSDQRDHLDLQVDLLAEQELTVVLRMLRRISEHLGVPTDSGDAGQAQQLTEKTNVHELMERIKRELPENED